MRRAHIILLLVLCASCAEPEGSRPTCAIIKVEASPCLACLGENTGAILITPDSAIWDAEGRVRIEIQNVAAAPLRLSSLTVVDAEGDATESVVPANQETARWMDAPGLCQEIVLGPSASITLDMKRSPEHDGTRDHLVVSSNDPANPLLWIEIMASP